MFKFPETRLPILSWLPQYSREKATHDSLAAVIVTLMLIPQSLAYAMLAGLPPVVGLYASILPLVAYTLLGTSSTLAVGPVAVIALMTSEALSIHYLPGSIDYISAASTLAALSGIVLLIMAIFRLGALTHFLSHPVLSGFMTASGILIIISQLKHILGVTTDGGNAISLIVDLISQLENANPYTIAVGSTCLLLLITSRLYLKKILCRLGISATIAGHIVKLMPVIIMLLSIFSVSLLDLETQGVSVVGIIPTGLPSPALPRFELHEITGLLPAAVILSIVGFVESASVGQTLAAKRRERISPNQELVALSGSNIVSAISAGFPVTGGLSRSIVNFDAGAATPMAGTLTAIGITITALLFTPLFENLPHSVLAAIIIVAVSSLVDIKAIKTVCFESKSEGLSMVLTIIGVLLFNVETGIIAGLVFSLLIYLWRSSRPHIAIVGLVPDTQHFRNIERHEVKVDKQLLTVRIDENLFFANARYLEDKIPEFIALYPSTKHLVLMCPGINSIDTSAQQSLHVIINQMKERDILVHLSEVKGPVMDTLIHTRFLEHLTGNVYLSQFDAYQKLAQSPKLRPRSV